MIALINSPLHIFLGKSFAVITVTGRKTGKPIETPINVVLNNQTIMVISLRNRNWWRNLRDGGVARLRNAGKQFQVRGEVIEIPAQVAIDLTDFFSKYPNYSKYLKVRIESDGKPNQKELERAAGESVLIKLHAI